MARTFTISDKQEAQFVAWKTEHQKTCTARPDFSMALYSIVFVPSGLGTSATVKCPCGGEIYLDADDVDL